MTEPRVTRSGLKKPATIVDSLISLTAGPSTIQTNVPTRSFSEDYALTPSVRSPAPGEGQQENFLPADRGGSITELPDEPDDPDGSDRDTDSDKSVSQPDVSQPDTSLARSLALLAEKIGSIAKPPKQRSRLQQRAPDIFDGTDPGKLDTFVFQTSLYMAARASDFPDEETRITFALSYLKGVPLDWFQGELARSVNEGSGVLAWFTSYADFVSELRRLFGPRDPVNDATNALELLRYKDSTKAARYTIDFNRHAYRTGWNNAALTRQYYKGLPDRLKDELSRIGKPVRLQALQDLVATLDQRHWERQSEISRDKRSTNNQSTSQTKSTSSDSRHEHRSNNNSKPTPANNSQGINKDQKKQQPPANASNSGNKTNTISDVLGPDGKLKPEERQRRMDNNLCLRCGKPGHKVNDCPVVSKAKPKGCAATVTPASTAAPAASASGKA